MPEDTCKILKKLIKDEDEAKTMYSRLKRSTNCSVVQGIATEFKDEEAAHARTLKEVYKQACKGQ